MTMTKLAMRLAVVESQAQAVAEVKDAYVRHRDLTRAADEFEVSRRTLERLMSNYPALAAAIREVRGW